MFTVEVFEYVNHNVCCGWCGTFFMAEWPGRKITKGYYTVCKAKSAGLFHHHQVPRCLVTLETHMNYLLGSIFMGLSPKLKSISKAFQEILECECGDLCSLSYKSTSVSALMLGKKA